MPVVFGRCRHGWQVCQAGVGPFQDWLTFVSRVNEALEGKLDPKEARQCVEEWETWSEDTVKIYSQVFTSTSSPAKKAFEEEPGTIKRPLYPSLRK